MTLIYDDSKEKMISKPDKGFENLVDEFYSRIGTDFPVKWKSLKGKAVPEIKEQDLPSNISMNDVETVLNNMKSEGWF